MTSIRFLIHASIIVLTAATAVPASIEGRDDPPVRLLQERTYLGRSMTYWLKVLRDREEESMSLAFDAIHSLGQDAWVAVPDLTRLVAAPFAPIDIGKDSHESVAAKLYDIAVRTEAIDTLGWIGQSASPSTLTLIRWALMTRVTPAAMRNADTDELFIELVTIQ